MSYDGPWSGHTPLLWDDLRAGAGNLDIPSAGYPSVSDTDGSLLFGKGETAFVLLQMPHSWWEGSAIHPHIHWYPTSANSGNVHWQISHSIADIGDVFPAYTDLDAISAAAEATGTHTVAEPAGAEEAVAMTGKSISAMIKLKITRVDDASDTYADDAALLEVDVHYQMNSEGSRQETVK